MGDQNLQGFITARPRRCCCCDGAPHALLLLLLLLLLQISRLRSDFDTSAGANITWQVLGNTVVMGRLKHAAAAAAADADVSAALRFRCICWC
jgi:hypothetical protein